MTTIRYFVTRMDLARGFLVLVFRNRFLWVAFLLFVAFIGYDALHDPNLLKARMEAKIAVWMLFSLSMFVFLFGGVFLVSLGRTLFGNTNGVLGEHRLSVNDEGLAESTAYNESLSRWPVYYKTVKTRGYLLLFMNPNACHVVSRKRPLLEGNLVEFERALGEARKNAEMVKS